MKEKLPYSEASQRVEDATAALFRTLEMGGIKVKEGMPDSEGILFTPQRVEELKGEINKACWDILRDGHEIVEEKPSA